MNSLILPPNHLVFPCEKWEEFDITSTVSQNLILHTPLIFTIVTQSVTHDLSSYHVCDLRDNLRDKFEHTQIEHFTKEK